MKQCDRTWWNLATYVFFLLLLGCGGGGGGGDEPSSTTRTYHLYDAGCFTPGYQITFSLSGSRNQRETITGSYSVATRANVEVDGKQAIHQETYVTMNIVNVGTLSDIEHAYLDAVTHDPIFICREGEDLTLIPITISERPDMAEIGDFGSLTSYAYSNGHTGTGTWSLQNAGNNLANLTMNFARRDSGGSLYLTEKITVKIDESGNCHGISFDIYYPSSGYRVVLSGTVT